MKKTKPVGKIMSSWKLLRAAFRDYRSGFSRYFKIIALVAIPINLVALLPASPDGTSSDPLGAFTPFAAIIMNVALIWALIRRDQTGELPTVAQAYYDGSAALVRYLLVSSVLVIMLLPAAFGATFYGIGVLGVAAGTSSLAEQLLIGFVALLLAVPSGYLLVRNGLAPFAVVRENFRPLAALRLSRALTAGRFWPVAGRMVMMIIFIALVSLPATALTLLLSLIHWQTFAGFFFEVATTLIALPLANLYLYKLYRDLERLRLPANEPEAEAAVELSESVA
jgi:hypothetical protein